MKLTMKNGRHLVALALTMSLACPLGASAAIFQDVQGHWAQNDIYKLSGENVLAGYPDGTFRPEGRITRAEFSTMLVKALNLPMSAPASASFQDVPTGHWAYPAIETVRMQGLVSGYPGGMFLPTQNITRAEAMSILAKAGRITLPDANVTEQILSRYSDQSSVPTWARAAVAGAIQAGVFADIPNASMIQPLAPATRAEVAVMTTNLRDARYAQTTPGQGTQAGTGTTSTTTTTSTGTATTGAGGQTVLQGRISTVPANTRFTGTLATPLSSEANRQGDTVTLTVDRPLVGQDGQTVVPVGSKINGIISRLEPSGRTGKNAMMDIDFNEIVTPDGQRIPIQGSIATEEGVLMGGTTKGRILRAAGSTAVGAGLGAALGTAMGPLSGGKVGKGAIYGTAVGAGVGALAAAAQKGKSVVVTTGDQLEIKLDSPISVEVGQ